MEFIIADPHLGETRLREAIRSEFKTDQELAEYFVDKWNSVVSHRDIVYILGDLGRKPYIEQYFPQLNGVTVLILGNHDTYSKEFYRRYFDYVYNKPFWLTSRILLSHIPQKVNPGVINIHGHTHEISLNLEGYYNVSVEQVNYTPVRMKKFYNALGRIPKPTYKFMYEWYAEHQITNKPREDLVFNEDGSINVLQTRKKLVAIKRLKK